MLRRNLICLFFLVALVGLLPAAAGAGHEHPEKWYQQRWCAEKNGQVEVVLSDRTRCDCLTDTNALEFDFGPKWAEAIGVRTCKSFRLKLQNLEISNCKTLKSIQTENCKSSSFKLQNLV
jgi:hypothetical protein